jgi:hypothetical protein
MATIAAATLILGVNAAAATQPDAIITSWIIGPYGSGGFIAQDTHDSGRGTITATFSASAVKGIPNLTQPDNVQALVAAMKAPDWGAAVGGAAFEFSADLMAKMKASGVNPGWVYQRLYAHMDPGATPPSWVPSSPQSVYLSGQGGVSQPPKPVPAEPTPVIEQEPAFGKVTETVPAPSHPAVSSPAPEKAAPAPKPASPAQQIAQAQAQEAQNAVVAVRPGPGAPAVLVPGAHTAPGWVQAQRTIDRARAAEARRRRWEIGAAAVAVALALVGLIQRRRGSWPFRPREVYW